MNQPNLPPDDATQSFVLRLWQTTSGQWRGSVRHVQSDARLAFLTLDQAVRWIERYLAGNQVTQQREGWAIPTPVAGMAPALVGSTAPFCHNGIGVGRWGCTVSIGDNACSGRTSIPCWCSHREQWRQQSFSPISLRASCGRWPRCPLVAADHKALSALPQHILRSVIIQQFLHE